MICFSVFSQLKSRERKNEVKNWHSLRVLQIMSEIIWWSFFEHVLISESGNIQFGLTQHFSTGKNLLKKILKKDKYWHNQLRKPFLPGKSHWKKYWEKINIDTIHWEKVFDRSAGHKKCSIPWLVNFNDAGFFQC